MVLLFTLTAKAQGGGGGENGGGGEFPSDHLGGSGNPNGLGEVIIGGGSTPNFGYPQGPSNNPPPIPTGQPPQPPIPSGGGGGGGGNTVTVIGNSSKQDPIVQSRHTPKATDKYGKPSVKDVINKTFGKQAFNNCTTASLGFVGQWIFKNDLNEGKVLVKNFQLNKVDFGKVISNGQDVDQNSKMIKSLYNTVTFTNFKDAIDKGNIVMTDVFVKSGQETDPSDPSKTINVIVTHAVAVIGYTDDGKNIFFDPSEGNFQTTETKYLNTSYAITISSTK